MFLDCSTMVLRAKLPSPSRLSSLNICSCPVPARKVPSQRMLHRWMATPRRTKGQMHPNKSLAGTARSGILGHRCLAGNSRLFHRSFHEVLIPPHPFPSRQSAITHIIHLIMHVIYQDNNPDATKKGGKGTGEALAPINLWILRNRFP